LVQFENVSCSFEIDDVSINGHLVFAGVWINIMRTFNGVTVVPQFPNDEVDVYHMAG
jgi:hypothetical protein